MTKRQTGALGMVLLGTVAGFATARGEMGAGGAGGAGRAVEVPLVAEDRSPMELGFGTCQWLYPMESSKKRLQSEPKYHSARPIYYAAVFGDAPDNVFTLVLDESCGTGKGYDTLYVDLNNENRLDGPGVPVQMSGLTASDAHPVRLKFQVPVGGTTVPYWISFTAFAYKDEKNPVEKIHANLRDSAYRAGQAVIGGKMHRIAIADLNSNGLFNDPETEGIFTGDRFFVDLNDDGKFGAQDSDGGDRGFPCGAYTRIAGQWYTIAPRADGTAVSINTATPPLGQVQASAWVTRAQLSSPRQAADLQFTDAKAEAVAGEYRMRSAALEMRDKDGKVWTATARWSKDRPQVTIPISGVMDLPIKTPEFEAVPTVTRSGENLMIGAQFTGWAGAEIGWPQSNAGTAKTGYEIRDSRAPGQIVASGKLEYG